MWPLPNASGRAAWQAVSLLGLSTLILNALQASNAMEVPIFRD